MRQRPRKDRRGNGGDPQMARIAPITTTTTATMAMRTTTATTASQPQMNGDERRYDNGYGRAGGTRTTCSAAAWCVARIISPRPPFRLGSRASLFCLHRQAHHHYGDVRRGDAADAGGLADGEGTDAGGFGAAFFSQVGHGGVVEAGGMARARLRQVTCLLLPRVLYPCRVACAARPRSS